MKNESMPLTKEHLKFIRNGDRISFHFNRDNNSVIRVTSKIGADLDVAAESRFQIYGDRYSFSESGIPRHAFAMIHSGQYDPAWMTIVHLLRAGDRLEMKWTGDGNGYTRKAHFPGDADTPAFTGLYQDTLTLIVIREVKGKKQPLRMEFNLINSICPDNTARMIQM